MSNPTNSIQYLGLTLNMGRILVHDCAAFWTDTAESSFFHFGFMSGLLDFELLQGIGIRPKDPVTGDVVRDESLNSLNIRNQMQTLQRLGPKILQKNMFQNSSHFFFRNDCILCFTPNVHLVNTDNFEGAHLFKTDWWGENPFRKAVRLNQPQQIMAQAVEEIVTDPGASVRPLDLTQKLKTNLKASRENDQKDPNELVWIQSNSQIIEKQIGKWEARDSSYLPLGRQVTLRNR